MTSKDIIKYHQDKVDNWHTSPEVKQFHEDVVEFLTSSGAKPPGPSKIPGNVVSAINLFLRYGEETKDQAHNGYYSQGGWPYETLKTFLEVNEK